MTMLLIILAIFAQVSCSLTNKANDKAMRAPSNSSSIDALPVCSRIKYLYSSPRIPIESLPSTFAHDVIVESKQIWQAGKLMEIDTASEGPICSPSRFQDLIQKPEWCKSKGWSGPYLEPSQFPQYKDMEQEDFLAYQNCWQK